MGIIQTLVSDYERDKLRLHAEMVVRFAQALEVTTDELLGIRTAKDNGRKIVASIRNLGGIEFKLISFLSISVWNHVISGR